MKKLLLIISILFLVPIVVAGELDLDSYFGDFTGCMVIMDAGTGETLRYHPGQCARRVSPCSTFKIPHAVFGLETGVLTGADHIIPWDGKKRFYDAWNQDLNLGQAIKWSAVPYFQEVSRRIGPETMAKLIKQAQYGNMDISAGQDVFWLGRSLKISPDEQVVFLDKLFSGQLNFDRGACETVAELLLLKETPRGSLYGKTGSRMSETNAMDLGWFVGFVDTLETRYFFAVNIVGGDNPGGSKAREISFKILEDMGFIGQDNPEKPVLNPGFTRLENGIYRVYEERTDQNRFDAVPAGRRVVTYDQSAMTGYPGIPVRYIVLDNEPGVPMVLRESPEKTVHSNGNPMLLLRLEKKYVDRLEEFTGNNINGSAAVVIDGKIITIHKIRAAITGGLIQITRCNDDACNVIFSKLTDSKEESH